MNSRNIQYRLLIAFALATFCCVAGCGSKVDLNKAKTVVETALTAWKNGESPKALESQGIEIVDADWSKGHKLQDYQIKNAAALPQQGPRVVVLLNMKTKAGKKVDTEVAYEVLFADKVKIGRDAFHSP